MLKVTHNAGFFSCCSVKLDKIINYFNNHKQLPEYVDSSEQFEWYKPPHISYCDDITHHFFFNKLQSDMGCRLEQKESGDRTSDDSVININYTEPINYEHEYQFIDYKTINYNLLHPFIKTYFSPSDNILNILNTIEIKYNLIENYENICVLFYRGNDKNSETNICSYEEIIEKARLVQSQNHNIIFLIQSDETEFIERMLYEFPNSFYLKDEIRCMNKCNDTVDKLFKQQNYQYSKYYLAITLIMSKCKYIVCTSGNCSIWIMLYRNNADNIFQYLVDKWV